MSPNNVKTDEIIDVLKKENKTKYGLLCLSTLLARNSYDTLKSFALKNNIVVDKEIYSKTGYLLNLVVHYYQRYKENKELSKDFKTSSDFFGNEILKDETIRDFLIDFDFISKKELIDAFSDFCADLGISVFDATGIKDHNLDLYLTKKTPLLKTENVVVRTGIELTSEKVYLESLNILKAASKIATWNVFVTTPRGVVEIGLDRMVKDMEANHIWLYVIDPIHKRVHGITKGKKSKIFNAEIRDDYIRKLPRDSIRSPSQVVKISKYEFNEGESYKSSDFSMFEVISLKEMQMIEEMKEKKKPKYREIFSNLMIIDKESGLLINRYSYEGDEVRDELTSSFLTAMDSFVSELAGGEFGESLKEINYQGFFIQAAYADKVKIALFLTEPADQALKDRLAYFIKYFESKYSEEIEKFKQTSEVSFFSKEVLEIDAKKILSI